MQLISVALHSVVERHLQLTRQNYQWEYGQRYESYLPAKCERNGQTNQDSCGILYYVTDVVSAQMFQILAICRDDCR